MISKNDLIIPGFDDDKIKDLTLQLDKIEDIIHIKCTGNIDTYNTTYFQKKMDLVFKRGYNKIIFDLYNIVYVSSTGIGSFTAFLKTLKAAGGDMCIINAQPKVFDVFQLLGFTTFFGFYQDLDEAVAALNKAKIVDVLFPLKFVCPVCTKKLVAKLPGKFRCPTCKTILQINENTNIFLV